MLLFSLMPILIFDVISFPNREKEKASGQALSKAPTQKPLSISIYASAAVKYSDQPPSCMTSVCSAEPSWYTVAATAAGPLSSPSVTV